MQHFQPQLVVFRKNALNYPLGEKLYQIFTQSQKDKQTPEVKIAPRRGKLPLNYDLPFSKKFHRAKEIINKAYPEHKLPMDDQQRKFKYGQFGYGKYVYPKEKWNKIKAFFEKTVAHLLPRAEIKYIV